jgi:ParB family chromosome partitioning protein
VPAIVKDVSAEQAAEMTIIENLQREDLNAMEQARAYERLAQDFGLTQEQMAQRTGKDRTTVANYLRLLRLPGEVQWEIDNGAMSFGHAKLLMSLPDAYTIKKVAKKVTQDALSVRQLEDLVFDIKHPIEKQPGKLREVDPNVREAEKVMERVLGVRVRIKDRKGRGKIVLEYKTLDDFDRICHALGANR